MHLPEVFNQLLARRIDFQIPVPGVVTKPGVDAVHAILHRRMTPANSVHWAVELGMTAKEVLDDLPVRTHRGTVLLISGRITIDVNLERLFGPTDQIKLSELAPALGTAEKCLARLPGI